MPSTKRPTTAKSKYRPRTHRTIRHTMSHPRFPGVPLLLSMDPTGMPSPTAALSPLRLRVSIVPAAYSRCPAPPASKKVVPLGADQLLHCPAKVSRKPTGIQVEAGTCGIPQAIKAVLRRPDGTLADSCAWTSGGPGYKSRGHRPAVSDNLGGPRNPNPSDRAGETRPGRAAGGQPWSTMQPSGRVGLVEGRHE
jgi:hypothetical protein